VVVVGGSVVGGPVLEVVVLIPAEVKDLLPTLTGWPAAPQPARKATRPIPAAITG
jgi:hypothetical protein